MVRYPSDSLASCLISRKQKVSVGEAVFTWTEVLSGVQQGSVLGRRPVLFVTLTVCRHSSSFTADDAAIFREICCRQDADQLQLDLRQTT